MILVDKHFQKSCHRLDEQTRFIIIDRLTNTNFDKEILRERLNSKQKLLDKKITNSFS